MALPPPPELPRKMLIPALIFIIALLLLILAFLLPSEKDETALLVKCLKENSPDSCVSQLTESYNKYFEAVQVARTNKYCESIIQSKFCTAIREEDLKSCNIFPPRRRWTCAKLNKARTDYCKQFNPNEKAYCIARINEIYHGCSVITDNKMRNQCIQDFESGTAETFSLGEVFARFSTTKECMKLPEEYQDMCEVYVQAS